MPAFVRLIAIGLLAVAPASAFGRDEPGRSPKPADEPGRSPKPPNVVFILADDLGWGDLACYGNRFIQTPNLDRLAKQGTLFTQFYVCGSVCSPSRCAFVTGQFPGRHGLHGHLATGEQNKTRGMPNWLDPKVPTLPRTLKAAGYTTAHIGKWHLGHEHDAPKPSEYGFDFVRATTSAADTWKEMNDEPYFRARSTGLFVDEAVKFLDETKGRPFYLQLWTLVPHAPLNPTPEQLKVYDRFAPPAKTVPYKSARQIFYASVTDLDTQIGRLMKALDDRKLADNTIVVFSAAPARSAGGSGVCTRAGCGCRSSSAGRPACPPGRWTIRAWSAGPT
jgi:N-acetylgalactosamine-6-sulfatase